MPVTTRSQIEKPSSPKSDVIQDPITDTGRYRQSVVNDIDNLYGSNVLAYCRATGKVYTTTKTLYAQVYRTKTYELPPRIKPTRRPSRYAKIIKKTAWKKGLPFNFTELEKAAKHTYGQNYRPEHLKRHIKKLGLSTKQTKNVTNASQHASCAVRVDRVSNILEYIEKNKIGMGSTKTLYFMDECNLNQLALQNNTVVGPPNVEIYRRNHKTVVTESLTFILLVDHKCNVVHHHLYHNKADGTTKAARVVEFLREAAAKILTTDTHPLFLDNAPTHRSAFKHSKDLDKWQPLWAAPSTPETNLAEFFFRELKRKLRQDVNSISETLTGPKWFKWVKEYIEKWVVDPGVKTTQYDHCIRCMKDVSAHEGDLQKVSLAKHNLDNMDDALDSLLSD